MLFFRHPKPVVDARPVAEHSVQAPTASLPTLTDRPDAARLSLGHNAGRGHALRVGAPLLLALSLGCGAVQAQVDATQFRAQVAALYDFHPRDLSNAQLTAKSAALDDFWSRSKASAPQVLPWLRDELAQVSRGNFFAYDGAKLLLSLSSERADRQLALAALPKVDFRDIDTTDYLRTVHRLAGQGMDTRVAALRILDAPDFRAIIPQHALTLGQNYALIYALFAMETVPFEDDLAQRLDTEQDVEAQKSLLLALWYTVTPAGKAALKAFSEKPDTDPAVSGYARELLARGTWLPSLSSAQSLRKERARVMQRPISDEALMEFDRLTLKLLAKS